ncbi:SDR family oxidoreductase [Nocardia sp. NBC_00565]|uniref:SDR family oxidoreductase n=1 Tax=Nocardia sp. NBC_00565 TaxID=2975993 RepID=UPI002E80A20F|nr:SDR family oxidoreductase [Nocardia sp. NBC_00565]WUC01931.1 SDR family oxidoreductase [Nocardia sp. NBC_00565]
MNHQEAPRSAVVVIGVGAMGLAIARRLGSGRRLLLADYSEVSLEAAAAACRGEGHTVESHTVDISDRGSVVKLAAAAADLGHLDAVVHTAGVSPTMATARQIYEVDLLGTAHVIDAFLAVASPGTSLVSVASMAGYLASLSPDFERHLATVATDQLLNHKGIDLDSSNAAEAYIVAKRGNQLRVQAAAHDWGTKGARLNTISPGVTSTPMGIAELAGPTGAYIQSMIDLSGARRTGTPDDIAATAAFLTGPESSFITGNDILVDGGAIAAQRWNTGN